MKYTAIVSLLLLFSLKTFSCLNLYIVNESGETGLYQEYPPHEIFSRLSRNATDIKIYESWIQTAKPDERYRYVSNYCVLLIELGHHKEALSILKKLNSEHPAEYKLISNLATAYELNGELDSAYKYMKSSLEINPHSHDGSEWFHILFLQAAIKLRDQGANIQTIDVLQLDSLVAGINNPKEIHSGQTKLAALGDQVCHQLKERLPLTNSPNALLAKTLEEIGDFYKKNISIDWAIKLYAIAAGYSIDETTVQKLWHKMEQARIRVVALENERKTPGKRNQLRKELISKTWRQSLETDVNNWKTHTVSYDSNLKILEL